MHIYTLPCYVYLLSDDRQNLFILCAYFISTVLWVIDNSITNILTFLFTFLFSELSKGIETLYDASADPFNICSANLTRICHRSNFFLLCSSPPRLIAESL